MTPAESRALVRDERFRIACPVCGVQVAVTIHGKIWVHGYTNVRSRRRLGRVPFAPCPASGTDAHAIGDDMTAAMRRLVAGKGKADAPPSR